ncbi:MAG: murein L,D-transpeptidase catalytic domain family protein [Flavobacteriales bacterium]
MVNAPLLLLFMASWLKVFSLGPVIGPVAPLFAEERHASEEEATFVNSAVLGAEVAHSDGALVAAQRRILRSTERPRYLAVADMTLPSTAERLYIIDLQERRLVVRMLVAHGQGSGELTCDRFSNREGSHATSKGLYRVGAEIVSPKHGPALLLHGLDEGQNCQALAREVIMHGADYVSADFIRSHGRLGRSWGCPAVPRQEMARIIELLADEGFLYVHGH